MLDRLPVIDQLLERIDANAQVHFQILLRDSFVTPGSLDSASDHRLVRDQQERPGGDLIIKAGDEQRRRFHVDRHNTNE